MPDRAGQSARRTARDLLRAGASMCSYADAQLSDGLNPEQARHAVLDVASELERVAVVLRRLARPDDRGASARRDDRGASARRAVALELAAAGWPRQAIAEQVGVSAETIRRYARVSSRR